MNPLFNTNIARFQLTFSVETDWRLYGKEPAIRGKLGLNLKRKCCAFPGFRSKVCEDCELIQKCLYIQLFSPIVLKNKGAGHSTRPFVISLESFGQDSHMLAEGEKGCIYVTLFGPAIRYCSLFLESIQELKHFFPIQMESLTPCIPTPVNQHSESQIAWPLADWISIENPTNTLRIGFVTPVRFKSKQQISAKTMNFHVLMQAIIRRLRDLKRAFSDNTDMGIVDNLLHQASEVIVSDNQLYWARRKRYSYRQHQEVYLNGFCGEIQFEGDLDLFLPYIEAAALVHVGKSTSAGNGRICISCKKKSTSFIFVEK
jgi:hypothetical protein